GDLGPAQALRFPPRLIAGVTDNRGLREKAARAAFFIPVPLPIRSSLQRTRFALLCRGFDGGLAAAAGSKLPAYNGLGIVTVRRRCLLLAVVGAQLAAHAFVWAAAAL